jgi:phosphate transport system substrate-binding protein
MFRRRRYRMGTALTLGVVLSAAALCSVAGMGQTSVLLVRAQGTATPTLAARPSTGLEDQQFTVLTFKGFPPSSAFDFRQCIAQPVTIATDCTAIVPSLTVVLSKKGTGNTYVPVYADSDSALENAGVTGSITCNNASPCVIAAMPDPNDLTTATRVPITFGQSPSDCPPPGVNGIVGAGASSAYRAIYAWESAFCQPPANLAIDYALRNSPDGVNGWFAGQSQFAVTGPWASAYKPVATPSTSPPTQTWKFAPLTASSVVLAYRIYDIRGPQVTTLTLTPAQVAEVFEGRDPDWGTDPTITALNPGVEFPTKITPYARADYSEETWTFTSWLAATSPTVWTYGAQEIFPAQLGSTDITGSAKLAFDVVTNPLGSGDWLDFGTIGFMDSSTAAFYGLPVLNIKNADGSVTAATPATVAQALTDASTTPNTDGTISPSYNPADGAWPMLLPTYLMAPTDDVSASVGKSIQQFLNYAVGAGQTSLPTGYVPLTTTLVNESLAAAKAIPTTAPSPTPTPTPTPTVAPVINLSIPPPVVPSATPFATPASTPATSPTPAPVTAPSAAVVNPSLLLTGSASQFVFPVVMVVAAFGLLGGAGFEALAWRRRRHTGDGD